MNREHADAIVTVHGSIVLVAPRSDRASHWIAENVQEDAQFWGGALVVEPRYLEHLVKGMRADGLVVL